MDTMERVAHPEATGDDERIDPARLEFVTTVRGREVRCWLEDGRLCGDGELLQRLSLHRDPEQRIEPVDLVHLVGDAVGSDVVIRFADSVSATGPTRAVQRPAR